MRALVLIGNMAAGKSSLAAFFVQRLGYSSIVIDRYRAAYGGDEYLARQAMLKDVNHCRTDIVYETTGSNLIHSRVMRALDARGYEITKVMLGVSKAVAVERHRLRGFGYAHPPNEVGYAQGDKEVGYAQPPNEVGHVKPTKGSFEESWDYMAEKLKGEWADLFFDTECISLEEVFGRIKLEL